MRYNLPVSCKWWRDLCPQQIVGAEHVTTSAIPKKGNWLNIPLIVHLKNQGSLLAVPFHSILRLETNLLKVDPGYSRCTTLSQLVALSQYGSDFLAILCVFMSDHRGNKKRTEITVSPCEVSPYFGGPMWLGFFMGWNSINLRQNHNPSKFETKFQVPISANSIRSYRKNPDSTFEFQKFRWGGMMITRPTTAWARCHWSQKRVHLCHIQLRLVTWIKE